MGWLVVSLSLSSSAATRKSWDVKALEDATSTNMCRQQSRLHGVIAWPHTISSPPVDDLSLPHPKARIFLFAFANLHMQSQRRNALIAYR